MFSAKAAGEIDARGTIQVGKAADLVLIEGEPWANISAVRNAVYTFVGGELLFGEGAPAPIEARHMTPAPVANPIIDDFDREDGRTSRNTLRVETWARSAAASSFILVSMASPEGKFCISAVSLRTRESVCRCRLAALSRRRSSR